MKIRYLTVLCLALIITIGCVTPVHAQSTVPSEIIAADHVIVVDETDNTPDEDTRYRFMQLLNSVFSFSAEVSTYTSPNPISLRIEPTITITERFPTPPLINQRDYPFVSYGWYGSVSSSGCGIACLAMAASYLLDEEVDVVELAHKFGKYNTPVGSSWALFRDSAEVLGIAAPERTKDTRKVMDALRNGQIVIASEGPGLFTDIRHFILLTGVNENGLITVNDPNGNSYTKNDVLRRGFAEGFTERQIFRSGRQYWIYGEKKLNIETLNDERVTVTYQLQVGD